jgi:hypothetical protein
VYFDEKNGTNGSFGSSTARWSRVDLLRRKTMTKRSKKNQQSQANLQDFVAVTFVENMDQAKEYEALLKTNDIPAVISKQNDQSMDSKAIAVMVPEDFLDEAHVVIESQDAYDDFYDFALEEEIDDDFDSDLFEDDF